MKLKLNMYQYNMAIRGATIRQKAYCNILQYGKPILQYVLEYAVLYYPNWHVAYLAINMESKR